jgi:hypothetical protein
MNVFKPQTCEKAAGLQRLLIADGHGSHIQGDFIACCMENKIDLLIMPPHYSHILQLLDVGVFAMFKQFHTIETHAISQLSSQLIPHAEWIELLSCARKKAMSKENILCGWCSTGLWSTLPMQVLRVLPKDHLYQILNQLHHTQQLPLIYLCYRALLQNRLNY